MAINVKIISKEIIKPIVSVADQLHHYKYSFIDQLTPSANFIPLIYFYSLDHKLSNNEKSSHLKTSLSQVLAHYYPLTGVIKEDHLEYCKDGGVLVLEAQVNCQLSEILESSHPRYKFINKFLPDSLSNSVLAIQVNFFNCGSIAIGACISHKIADALSFITFIKNWADTACGNGENVCPNFESATTLFPPRPEWNRTGAFHQEENVVLKRFVFTNSNISALKEKYGSTSNTEEKKKYPSRFEVLTSFLLDRFITSTKIDKGPNKRYLLSLPVNLRQRMDPPLSNDYFGNLLGSALSIISPQNDIEGEVYHHYIVNKLTESINKINNYFVNKGNEDIFNLFGKEVFKEIMKSDMKEFVSFNFSSLCRFPIYEADFGWGSPILMAYGNISVRNHAHFIDARNGDGVEAWIHLTEEDMAKFESDEELLTYASPTPFP